MTTAQDTKQLQIQRAILAIKELAPNITDEDKKLACEKLRMNYRSLARYWKEGTGKNLDTAVKLISFFKKRILDREKLIG